MGLFSGKKNAPKGKTAQSAPKATPVKLGSRQQQNGEPTNLSKSKLLKQPLTYPYTALNPAIQEIRVLNIVPGIGDEPLCCMLRHTSLARNTVQYESISYCWGLSREEEVIVIDGVRVAVRRSAANVLRRMRLHNMSRVVWIDGICIDQNSFSERSQQVSIMGLIYSRTVRNLIWLGDDGGSAKEVERVLNAVFRDAYVRTNGFRDFWRMLYPDGFQAIDGTFLNRDIDLTPLIQFFSVEWFSRVWIVQEAVLPRNNVCYYGNSEFRLENILRAAVWISFNRLLVPTSLKDIQGLKRASNIWTLVDKELIPPRNAQAKRMDLYLLYTITQEFEASESRDKIFGLLGMFQSGLVKNLPSIFPDYQKPLLDVFRDATRYMIESSRCLQIFRSNMAAGDLGDASCPSWIVDFARDRFCDRESRAFALFSADHGEHMQLTSTAKSDQLNLAGLKVTVVSRHTARFNEQDVKGFIASAQNLFAKTSSRSESRGQEGLVITLIAGINAKALPAKAEDLRDFESFLQYLRKHGEPPLTRPDLNVLNAIKLDRETYLASRYWSALQLACRGRCVFATADGCVGLGPRNIQKNDIIAILFGAPNPIVLRPSAGAYKLVGECYLHGTMHGEAVQEHRARNCPDERFEIV